MIAFNILAKHTVVDGVFYGREITKLILLVMFNLRISDHLNIITFFKKILRKKLTS